jgi:hypothetical protein
VQSKWVPYDKISNNLKRAVLVSEDDIFFQHKGVRVEDMQKAWQKNQQQHQQNQQKSQVGNKSKVALRGGSTITQQLAKNLFLSSEQNYLRKGQELIITGLLELTLSKQRLYEIYLNSVLELAQPRSTITLQAQQCWIESRQQHLPQHCRHLSVLISNSIAVVEVLTIPLVKNLSWTAWIEWLWHLTRRSKSFYLPTELLASSSSQCIASSCSHFSGSLGKISARAGIQNSPG